MKTSLNLILLIIIGFTRVSAQTKQPYTLKNIPLGKIAIPAGANVKEDKVPLNSIMAGIFNEAKYYMAIDPGSGITAFAYDFEFKKPGSNYDHKGAANGLVDKLASALSLIEVRKTMDCDTNWCFTNAVYVMDKDTLNIMLKSYLGNKFLSVYGVMADKKQLKLQKTLMQKSILKAAERNVVMDAAESRKLIADSNSFGVIYLFEGQKLSSQDIPLTGLLANMFSKSRYYYNTDQETDVNVFVYDYQFKKPGDAYNLQVGLGGVTEKFAELLSLEQLSNEVKGDDYDANSDGLFVNEKQDTFRMIFKAKREQKYMTMLGTLCPVSQNETQQKIMNQSVIYGVQRKKE